MGAISQDDIGAFKACKDQIVALLEDASPGAAAEKTALQSGGAIDLVPLAFSQLAHWHTERLAQQRSHCVVGFPTRWLGPLNVRALESALREMIRRHHALRTRIVVCQGTPLQEIRDCCEYELIFDDLAGVDEAQREGEILRRVDKYMCEPIDVTVYPLFRFRLIRVREDDHVLVTAMEHIITDGVSLNLLQRELLRAYQDVVQGRPLSLPPVGMQFSDFAMTQRHELPSWIEQHAHYWAERLKGCERLRFPEDGHERGTLSGFGLVHIHFRKGLREDLREWGRQNKTTLVMSFFTAFVALVLRWCNVPEAVLLFQISGRTRSVLDCTFGYLASPLFLRLALLESDKFIDLLRTVTDEYYNAYEHADCSYLEAQQPPPAFALNSRFNWLPQAQPADRSAGSGGREPAVDVTFLPYEPRVITDDDIDTEPLMGILETEDGIVGYLGFPLARFSVRMMERFAHNFEKMLEILLNSPETKVTSIVLD